MHHRFILAGTVVLCLLCSMGLEAQQSDSSVSNNTNLPASSQSAAGTVPRLVKFAGEINPAPSGITQTTQIRESEGGKNPLRTVVGVTFSLYELQEGGSPLWSESQKVQVDEQGHYSVLLGATQPEGLPLDLFTSGKALWVGVQPQLPGQAEQPRVLLVAVPYSLKSSDADTLGGLPASAYALAGSATLLAPAGAALSSASTSTAQPASQAGAAAGSASSPQPLAACTAVTSDGTATANTVAKFTAACKVENSLIRDNGSGVAVGGTSAPGALLDVQYTSTGTTGLLLGQRVLTTLKPAAASSAITYGIFSSALTASGNTQNFTGNNIALDSEVNHYGLGTLVQGHGMRAAVVNRANGTVTNAYGITAALLNASMGKITNGYGVYVNAPTNSEGGTFSNYTGLYIASPTAVTGAYGLYSAGGKNYFGGNVGIGTTTPGAKLEVNGTGKFDGLVTFASSQTFPGGTVTGSETVQGSVTASGQLVSTVATGTAPLSVASTTLVPNLNADTVDGLHASAFQPVGSYATLGANTFAGTQTISSGDLALPDTASSGFVGVVTLGGVSFLHDCCGGSSQGNTFLGAGAGNFTTTGSGNTAIGSGALGAGALQAPTANNNTASGNQSLSQNTTGSGNTASGAGALLFNTTGSGNTAVGASAGVYTLGEGGHPMTGSNSTYVGAFAAAGEEGLTNATAIGYMAQVGESNALVLGAPATVYNTVTANTKVGIDVSNPSNILTVLQGGGHAISDGWDTYSSRRWKSDIQPLRGALGKVERLRGVSYTYTANGKHDIGMIAEEVGKVVPEVVSYEDNGKDARGIDYARLTALLVEAMKQQQAEIAKLQSQLAEQRKQGQAQQAELSQVLAQVRVIQARLAGKSATRPRIRAAKNAAAPAKTPKAAPPNTKDAANRLVAKVRF